METPIRRFLGRDHGMTGVELEDGSTIALEPGLVAMGSHYHNEHLKGPDLEWKGGNLGTDGMGHPSYPQLFAIGDLKEGLNQVSMAVADGMLAATAIWREIRRQAPPRRWEVNL